MPRHFIVIDGERVTIEDIAKRLGISRQAAKSRLHRERAKPSPVTWAGLTGKGRSDGSH
jgi:predicted ArsR family transcriptional regulator